ncbi:MAG: MMPL family transporter [Gammaproteobacteria bacterium]|nr:MMPL family transporter [Gammaproteobacteria bacterium]
MRDARHAYDAVLAHHRALLVLSAALLALAMAYWPRFSFDASSDTLVVEGDPALAYYQEVAARFGNDEFVVLTYSPKSQPLFSEPTLQHIAAIEGEIEALSGVARVFSVLDAPLLESPQIELTALADGYRTLRSPDVDLDAAKTELAHSPLFSNLLSSDGQTTALRIDLAPEPRLDALIAQRRAQRLDSANVDASERANVQAAYAEERAAYRERRDHLIASIRDIKRHHTKDADLHIGGVPMIAADMIDFVRSDVTLFGSVVLLIVIVMLYLFFRRLRWVVLPIVTSAVTIAWVVGWLGFLETPVTVVSANFISLLAIITISFTIHLIVRYRELIDSHPDTSHAQLVAATMRSKFAPCLYTALTTMVAFGSLMSSRIEPVVDFGWMMCVGVLASFAATYMVFPALLLAVPKGTKSTNIGARRYVTETLSRVVRHHHRRVLVAALVIAATSILGMSLVSLDNRFIDYFDTDTEIHQGMRIIDEELGGTVPFEIIISFAPHTPPSVDRDDDFAFADDGDYPERYWFTPDKIEVLGSLQTFLLADPQIGSVTSLANMEMVGRRYNDGRPLDGVQLALILGAMPDAIRTELIDPYADPHQGELRLTGRVKETGPFLDRDALLASIHAFGKDELGFDAASFHVTGMLVLFNNTLRQLFESQTSTISYVLIATFAMFLVLLRSVKLAILGLIPNVLAAATVIAIMGYAGIPLDMMTITIAAICIGIGVDDAIHYLHRFREEFAVDGKVVEAVRRSHGSIGQAMYFTSITVIAGFSILAASNFVPTVHFGLLTALAMALALVANLTLLPSLLISTTPDVDSLRDQQPETPP